MRRLILRSQTGRWPCALMSASDEHGTGVLPAGRLRSFLPLPLGESRIRPNFRETDRSSQHVSAGNVRKSANASPLVGKMVKSLALVSSLFAS